MGGARQRPINPPQSRCSTHAPTGPGAFSDMQSDGLIVVPYARGTIGTRTVASLSRSPVLADAKVHAALPFSTRPCPLPTTRRSPADSRCARIGIGRGSSHLSTRRLPTDRNHSATLQLQQTFPQWIARHIQCYRLQLRAAPMPRSLPGFTGSSRTQRSRGALLSRRQKHMEHLPMMQQTHANQQHSCCHCSRPSRHR